MKFFVNAALDYYLAKADFEHKFWFLVPANWDAETSGGGLGFHGGLGMEYGFTPQFGLIVEVKGRYAAFSNFEGSVVWSWPWGGTPYTEEGQLLAFEDDFGGSIGEQTWLWISESEPSGDIVRQAKVDFKGMPLFLWRHFRQPPSDLNKTLSFMYS